MFITIASSDAMPAGIAALIADLDRQAREYFDNHPDADVWQRPMVHGEFYPWVHHHADVVAVTRTATGLRREPIVNEHAPADQPCRLPAYAEFEGDEGAAWHIFDDEREEAARFLARHGYEWEDLDKAAHAALTLALGNELAWDARLQAQRAAPKEGAA